MLDQMVDIDPSYIKMMMEVVAANKPTKLGIVIFDYLSLEAAHQGASFLRDMDIPSRVFTDLDELYHWMDNGE